MIQQGKLTLVVAVMLSLFACATTNPFLVAETPEQTVYALERTYNIVLESALVVVQDPRVPERVKREIRHAEEMATPILDEMDAVFAEYVLVKLAVDAGRTPAESLAIVAENLDAWIERAQAALLQLSATVDQTQ